MKHWVFSPLSYGVKYFVCVCAGVMLIEEAWIIVLKQRGVLRGLGQCCRKTEGVNFGGEISP